jgi:hypothetical protein
MMAPWATRWHVVVDEFDLSALPGADGGSGRGKSGSPSSPSSGASGNPGSGLSRNTLFGLFWAAAAASVILPRLPYGRQLMYPFSLVGVWAHEMGHGLTALLTGNEFRRLEIFENLGGLAYTAGTGRVTGALVSAGGLLGPAVFGALIIIFGARRETAKWVLAALSVLVALSIVAFIRNGFGMVAMGLIAAVLVPVAFYAPEAARIFVAQLIGIRLVLASWLSLDYMFTDEITLEGQRLSSDTGSIADALFLPYWFWGGLIAVLSALILIAAFYYAWVRPYRQH